MPCYLIRCNALRRLTPTGYLRFEVNNPDIGLCSDPAALSRLSGRSDNLQAIAMVAPVLYRSQLSVPLNAPELLSPLFLLFHSVCMLQQV